jgi:hypothetical protein
MHDAHPYLYHTLGALASFFTGGAAHLYLRRAVDSLPPPDPKWSWTRQAIYAVIHAIADTNGGSPNAGN